MTIPQEIQDLMPERKIKHRLHDYSSMTDQRIEVEKEGFNQALTEVEAVLPQIIALAEKRGAEGERERWTNYAEMRMNALKAYPYDPPSVGGADTLEELLQTLTQPDHDQ